MIAQVDTKYASQSGGAPSTNSLAWFVACLVLLIFLSVSDSLAFAKRPAPDPDRIVSDLTLRLSLSKTQAEQIRPVIVEKTRSFSAIFEKAEGGQVDRRVLRSQAKALREDTDRKLARILTAEQMKKYEEFRELRRQRQRG